MFLWEVRKQESAISRVLSTTIIHLGQSSPTASSNLPGSPLGTGGADKPRTPLFGLAPGGVYRAANCYQSRGALLPHLFTLTDQGPEDNSRRYIFCGTFHGLAPPRRYLAPCPKEPGLSSVSQRLAAIVWPTPAFSGTNSTGKNAVGAPHGREALQHFAAKRLACKASSGACRPG